MASRPTYSGSGSTHTDVAQLDVGHVHGSSVCAIAPCKSARNVTATALTGPGASRLRSAAAHTIARSKAVRSTTARTVGEPTGGQVAATSASVGELTGPGAAASTSGSKS